MIERVPARGAFVNFELARDVHWSGGAYRDRVNDVGHAHGAEGAKRLRRSARVLAALGVCSSMAAAVVWYGCSVYDSALLLPAADSGPPMDVFVVDSGPDAHDAGKEAGPNPCPDFEPPAAPAADDPSDAGDQSFVVAVHTIDFGVADAGTAGLVGYDLDKVYTCCEAGPESCGAAVTGATHCDESSGRDNAGGDLISSLALVDPSQFSTATISQRLQVGTYSILLQIQHYNGQANDTQVTASLYGSIGVESDAGALWNGTDQWIIDDSFVVSPDASPLVPVDFDTAAYVADGTLVIHVTFPISLGNSNTSTFTINLTAGVITGNIVSAGNGTYSLTGGNIAGRWNITQLLSSLQTVYVTGLGPVCPGSSTYNFVKSEICKYADIMTDPTKDLSGATCDALSLGIGFTADPALLGDVGAGAVKMALCPGDSGPDECTP
jgi:hypothetical protein